MKASISILLLALAAPLAAQLKENVTVSVVEVPVNVVTRDGQPVRGLSSANFELWDNGKKRMISGFEAIDFATGNGRSTQGSETATSALNPAARRNFLLLFDLSYSNPNSLQRAEAAARDFLSKSVNARDRVAVGTFDANRGFRLVTAFTTDRSVVRSAIDDPTQFVGTDPLQITAVGPSWELPGGSRASNASARTEASTVADGLQQQWQRRSADFDDTYRRQQVDRQLEILSMISRTMHTVIGRKEVILLSEGFDPKLIQGRKPLTKEGEQDQISVERGEIWNVNTDQTYGNTGSQTLLARFAEMCRRSDVKLHAIDIMGLRGPNDPQVGSNGAASNEGLHLLANAGGGDVFKNTNDLASSFDRLVHQQEVTYVLSFRAPTSEPGAFHELKVKVVGAPSGARVSHRSGYYEAGTASDAERALATAEIMVNDIPQTDIRLDVLPSIFHTGGGRAAVPVVVDINGDDLMHLKDDVILVAEVYVYAFDANGSVRDSLYQRLTLDTEKLEPKLHAGGVKYLGTLSLPAGAYAVKTLVRLPELGKFGFLRRDLTVPDGGDVAMSPPLFFEDNAKWVLVKGTSHDPSGAYPFIVGDNQFVPSAAARLEAGPRRFAVFVANATRDAQLDVTPAASFVGRSGDAFIYELDPSVAKAARLDVALHGTTVRTSIPLHP